MCREGAAFVLTTGRGNAGARSLVDSQASCRGCSTGGGASYLSGANTIPSSSSSETERSSLPADFITPAQSAPLSANRAQGREDRLFFSGIPRLSGINPGPPRVRGERPRLKARMQRTGDKDGAEMRPRFSNPNERGKFVFGHVEGNFEPKNTPYELCIWGSHNEIGFLGIIRHSPHWIRK